MAAIKDNILALRTVAATHLPAATKFYLQDVPETPAPGALAIRLTNQSATDLTALQIKVDRLYQLIYFGKTNIDVIDAVDALSQGFSKQTTLGTGAGHITLGAFSMSQPFKTEGGIHAVICILPVSFHDNRIKPVYPKVDRVVLQFAIDDLQDGNTFNDILLTGNTFDELAASATMDDLLNVETGRAQHTQDIKK